MKRAFLFMLILLIVALPALGETALSVNGREITSEQANAWMYIVKSGYDETLYYYKRMLGINYWELTYTNGRSMWENVKADAFKQLVMISVFCDMAEAEGISLSEDEIALCHSAANGECACEGFDAEDLCRVYQMRLLAGKAYSLMLSYQQVDEDEIIASVNKSEYISYEIEYIYVPYYMYSQDAAAKAEARELLISLKGFEGSYRDAARLNKYVFYGEESLCVSECADESLMNAVKALSVGEASDPIETYGGLFVIRLINDSDESIYFAEIDNRLLEAKKSAYRAEYNRLYASAEYQINAEYWDNLTP